MSETETSTATLDTAASDAQGADPNVGAPDGSATQDVGTANAENSAPAADPVAPSTTDQRSEQSPSELLAALRKQRETSAPTPEPGTAPTTPTQQAPTAEHIADLTKKHENLQAVYGRQAQELGDLRRFRQEHEQRQAQEAAIQQQKAAQADVKPWNRRHPEFNANAIKVERVKNFMAAREALPADVDQNVVQQLAKRMGVTSNDAKLHDDWQAAREQTVEQLQTDPEGWFEQRFEQRFNQEMERREKYEAARWRVDQMLSDPKTKPLLEQHADAVKWAIDHPQRHEVGLELARLAAENQELRNRMKGFGEQVATAQARDTSLKARATVKRDPATAVQTDVMAEATRRGLEGPALLRFLQAKRSGDA